MTTWKRASKKRKKRVAPPVARAEELETVAYRDRKGVVHLVLQKHASGQLQAAGLSSHLFEETWQETLTLATANAVLRHLHQPLEVSSVESLVLETMNALSKLASGLSEQSRDRPVACSAGCAHCCHQSVGVTGMEALTVAQYLARTLTPDAYAHTVARIRKARDRTRGLEYRARFHPDLPCAFLSDSGHCTIYPVRPLVCRAVNSLDAEQCSANLNDDEQRATYLRTNVGADALLGPIRASHAISAGLQLAGQQVYGLDMRPLDLIAAVDELLSNPDAAKDWLEGSSTLSGARGSDATSNPHLRTVAGLSHEPNA